MCIIGRHRNKIHLITIYINKSYAITDSEVDDTSSLNSEEILDSSAIQRGDEDYDEINEEYEYPVNESDSGRSIVLELSPIVTPETSPEKTSSYEEIMNEINTIHNSIPNDELANMNLVYNLPYVERLDRAHQRLLEHEQAHEENQGPSTSSQQGSLSAEHDSGDHFIPLERSYPFSQLRQRPCTNLRSRSRWSNPSTARSHLSAEDISSHVYDPSQPLPSGIFYLQQSSSLEQCQSLSFTITRPVEPTIKATMYMSDDGESDTDSDDSFVPQIDNKPNFVLPGLIREIEAKYEQDYINRINNMRRDNAKYTMNTSTPSVEPPDYNKPGTSSQGYTNNSNMTKNPNNPTIDDEDNSENEDE